MMKHVLYVNVCIEREQLLFYTDSHSTSILLQRVIIAQQCASKLYASRNWENVFNFIVNSFYFIFRTISLSFRFLIEFRMQQDASIALSA